MDVTTSEVFWRITGFLYSFVSTASTGGLAPNFSTKPNAIILIHDVFVNITVNDCTVY